MARERQEFALVGYSEVLERRPLKFVEPIPASRICAACGNIPRVTYTLVCGHSFCKQCYESSATGSERVCPLDGEAWGLDDVTRKEYPAENLLRRKVHCWNEATGCGVVLPASQIAEHVRHDCQHHVTRCPNCSVDVLSRDVCAHLKSLCTALALHSAPEAQPRTDDNERTQFVTFQRNLEQRVRELNSKLAQLSLESGSQNDKLVELCHNNINLKEALAEQFEALTRRFERASVQSIDRLSRNEADMKALVACEKTIEERVVELDAKLAVLSLESGSQADKIVEVWHNTKEALREEFKTTVDRKVAEIKAFSLGQRESLMKEITSVLASPPSEPKTHQRVVTGYAELKKGALENGWSRSMSDKLSLRHYLMSWGIEFKKEGETMYFALCIQLHEGTKDDFVDWPFTKELKLSVIHPVSRQERLLRERVISSEAYKKNLSRPIGGSNVPIYFSGTRVKSSDIERDGYVKEDQLLLRLEVLL